MNVENRIKEVNRKSRENENKSKIKPEKFQISEVKSVAGERIYYKHKKIKG